MPANAGCEEILGRISRGTGVAAIGDSPHEIQGIRLRHVARGGSMPGRTRVRVVNVLEAVSLVGFVLLRA